MLSPLPRGNGGNPIPARASESELGNFRRDTGPVRKNEPGLKPGEGAHVVLRFAIPPAYCRHQGGHLVVLSGRR